MNAPSAEALHLARIRARLDAISPGDWSRVYDDEGCFVEARGPMGELLPVARFHSGASDDEIALICEAAHDIGFLLGLVDRAIERLRTAAPPGREGPVRGPKDYAAECAMKCAEAAFRLFLEERYGLEQPLTDAGAAQKVRYLLCIASRRELNEGGDAAQAWRLLVREFEQWRRLS